MLKKVFRTGYIVWENISLASEVGLDVSELWMVSTIDGFA